MKKISQIKYGAVLSYSSIALNILAGLLYTPWMIDQIGQSQYGLYTLANSLIILFIMDFGLSSATARYLSRYRAIGDEEKIDNFLGAVYKLYLAIDMVILTVLTVVFFLIDSIYVSLTPQELSQFKVVYLISAGFSLLNFPFVTLNGILTAYEKFIPLKFADIAHKAMTVMMMVLALLAGQGLYALVLVNAASGIMTTVFKLIVIRESVPVKVNWRYFDKELYKEIFGFSIWSTVAALAQRLVFNITPSILGIMSDSAAIAVFGVIATIEGYAYTISSAINGMFMPKVSRIYACDNAEKNIFPLMMSVGRFQYALNGLIIVGFAIIGRDFILCWMGPDYLQAYAGILLVIVPNLFFNSLQIANTAIVVTKHVSHYACINLLMGLTNVCLSFPLCHYFGLLGSCLSIFIAYILRAVLLNILYYKKLRIDIITFAKECYLKMAVPMIAAMGIGFVLTQPLPKERWLWLVIKGCIVTGVYAIMILAANHRTVLAYVRRKQK